jgi:drug/metabolite transporter (DMT)-like permease
MEKEGLKSILDLNNNNSNILNSPEENSHSHDLLNKTNMTPIPISNTLPLVVNKKIKLLLIRRIIGLVFLIIVIFLSTLSSIWVKNVSRTVKPFLLTYTNYILIVILIPITFIKRKIIEKCNKGGDKNINTINSMEVLNKLEYNKIFHVTCIILMLLWILGNAFYNVGKSMASITTSNSLSNSAIIFILLGKVILFKSKCTIYKIFGLIICTVGVGLMTAFEAVSEKDPGENTILGDIYLILGAFLYAGYALIIKHYSKKFKRHFDMMEVFGYIGLYNTLLMPFFILFLHFCNIEIFQMPTWTDILCIFINTLIAALISDLFQSYSITLLSPHLVSFGLAMNIPLSYLFDILKGNIQFNLYYLFGSILIVSAFGVNLYESYKKYIFKKKKSFINSVRGMKE